MFTPATYWTTRNKPREHIFSSIVTGITIRRGTVKIIQFQVSLILLEYLRVVPFKSLLSDWVSSELCLSYLGS